MCMDGSLHPCIMHHAAGIWGGEQHEAKRGGIAARAVRSLDLLPFNIRVLRAGKGSGISGRREFTAKN